MSIHEWIYITQFCEIIIDIVMFNRKQIILRGFIIITFHIIGSHSPTLKV